jgi:cytochrome b561
MYWMSKKTIINSIENSSVDLTISSEQKSSIVKSIMSPMWEWHEIAAYLILAVFSIRIIYMIVRGISFPNPFKSSVAREKFQGWIYIFFYIFLAISTITGFYLKWFGGELKETMETIHKWGIYIFPIFIIIHFIGIAIAENTHDKGITSKMIGGDKKN